MTLQELAKALRGTVSGPWVNVRAPGHSGRDRSLGILFDPDAPDGFWVHSLSGDDPIKCRSHVGALLQRLLIGGSLTVECGSAKADEAAAQFRIRVANIIWDEAQPIPGTTAQTYLSARGCPLTDAIIAADALRFHPVCPFGPYRFPAMVSLMRNVVTSEPVGIHRTALRNDGLGKRSMPDGMNSKMMMGRAKGAAVMLQHASTHLGISEGIESALSASLVFSVPVWAALSAGALAEFPVIHGLKHLTIFADNDAPGLRAASASGRRYAAADIEGEIQCPPGIGSDWNSYAMEKKKWGSKP